MTDRVNIAFQGGTHGNYLRFCIDKFSTHTPDIIETPFTENNTSHKQLNYSGQINRYHPLTEEPYFKNTDERHILITVDKEDVMYIERWVTMRAGDHKVDVTQESIPVPESFLEDFPWADKFKKYYNVDLTKESIPKFLMRDFYKLSFMDLDRNGFIEFDKKLRSNKPKKTFCFPVSSFWDKDKFFDTLRKASEHLQLNLDISDTTVYDGFINGLNFMDTKDRVHDVIKAIQNNQDMDISNIDVVEQAYLSAWLEQNHRFVTVPLCDQFFKSTNEIRNWLNYYPEHYKAMNPNLPTFNGIPNPYYLAKLKK